MNRYSNAPTIRPPLGNYSHVVEVPAGSTLYYLAGHVGSTPEGEFPPTVEGQLRACYENIEAVLTDKGLTWRDIVRIKTLVVAQHMQEYREVRKNVEHRIPSPPPASTLIGVACLARPEMLVEVEVIAAAMK